MKRQIITSVKFLVMMTLLTGIIYPVLVSIITHFVFPYKSRGSLIERNGIIIGSELIGQFSDNPKYFFPRPSATNYNSLPSGASNLGQLNPELLKRTRKTKQEFLQQNLPPEGSIIPGEMITSSASGLDPHISREGALLQVNRVARARGMSIMEKNQIIDLINNMTEKRQFSLLGEPRINVFLLNLKLDSLK